MVFDRYGEISAEDHERQRRVGVGPTTFNLNLNSPLPSREAVMSKHKSGLSRLSTFSLGFGVTVESRDDDIFLHDEADITIISYLLQAALDVPHLVRVLSDDTDIFVLLVFWAWRYALQDRLAVPMKKWNGVVLDINATCSILGGQSVFAVARSPCSNWLGYRVLPYWQRQGFRHEDNEGGRLFGVV